MKYSVLKNDPEFKIPGGKNSHNYIMEIFKATQPRSLKPVISKFYYLKNLRKIADYEPIEIDSEQFCDFEKAFNKVNGVLKFI